MPEIKLYLRQSFNCYGFHKLEKFCSCQWNPILWFNF